VGREWGTAGWVDRDTTDLSPTIAFRMRHYAAGFARLLGTGNAITQAQGGASALEP
jgi:hypothetical protein